MFQLKFLVTSYMRKPCNYLIIRFISYFEKTDMNKKKHESELQHLLRRHDSQSQNKFGHNGSSYLMDVYGRLRVRVYNTLHRAIRKSNWGPVRCNIALHLKIRN